MKIDRETVRRIAALAKLEFTDEEAEKIEDELSMIVTYFEKMNELDTSKVAPLVFMTDEINVFRQDMPEISITKEQALMNAPAHNSDYFKVPKFLDRTEP